MDDMGGMGGMGGMDMGGNGLFQSTNMRIARIFWYIVAAAIAVRGLRTLIDKLRSRSAKTKARSADRRPEVPSRPTNTISQAYDTAITICREAAYLTVEPWTGKFTRYFSLPPLGHCMLILTYWLVILVMLWSDVILKPSSDLYGYKWEIVAYRAAWVSVTQIPLIYALSCKFNIISILTGISYERLNWMHRWVSRTVFLAVIVHWSYFFREWDLANFVQYELAVMPMVTYGFAAWALIGWTLLTGYGLFRDLCYELWLLQHVASAGVLLWLLYVHLPSYARYNVWLSLGFVALDRVIRGAQSIIRNTNFKHAGTLKSLLGFHTTVETLPHDYLKVSIPNAGFKWRPGQHIFISIPTCGFLQSHPFTIASDPTSTTLTLFIKPHSGFTRNLQQKTKAAEEHASLPLPQRAFISGPWGNPPLSQVERADSMVFIASSTGAAYTLPLFEHALRHARFARSIHFNWIIRHREQLDWFRSRLEGALTLLDARPIESLSITVFVTGSAALDMHDAQTEVKDDISISTSIPLEPLPTKPVSLSSSSSSSISSTPHLAEKQALTQLHSSSSSTSESRINPQITILNHRPRSLDTLIRSPVESALGETLIVACGGKSLLAQIRTYTARLSDERAVHKGSGAQGIGLVTECYGW